MTEGAAALNGVEGFGLMRIVKGRFETDYKGHFRAKRDEDHFGALFDCFRSRGHPSTEGLSWTWTARPDECG